MTTLKTAENALKSAYLGVLAETLNTETSPFLAMVKKTSDGVYGKEIRKMVRSAYSAGIGAGTEDGNLPAAGESKYVQFVSTLKNLYGQIEISDKAIRATKHGEGAFVDLLNAETEGLIKMAKFNLNRMIIGDGTGCLGTVDFDATRKFFDFYEIQRILPGMVLDVYNNTGATFSAKIKIKSVDYNLFRAYLEQPAPECSITSRIYIADSKDKEISGIDYIFNNTSIYGVAKAGNENLWPTVVETAEVTDEVMQDVIDMIEMKSGSAPDIILCSYTMRKQYIKYLESYKRNIDVMNLAGGFKAISYNGIPIVADRNVETNTMFFLSSKDYKLCELCDWTWLENGEGNILHQNTGKATYTATIVKYADLICEKPFAQGKLKLTNP